MVRRAIVAQKTLRFHYTARHSQAGVNVQSLRDADPYALVHTNGAWSIIAFCHIRNDIRYFRLERMEQLTVLERTFKRLPSYRPQARGDTDRRIVVRVLFEGEIARWVREERSYFTIAEEERADGLLVTLKVRQEEDVLQWLLGWGGRVYVLEPLSLRRRLAEEAQTMLLHHSDNAIPKN
jgi:predicted DNA-binding transcriptional regulator YafY